MEGIYVLSNIEYVCLDQVEWICSEVEVLRPVIIKLSLDIEDEALIIEVFTLK